MAAVDRNRRPDQMQTHQRYLSGPAASQPPSLHHHHSMSNPIGAAMSQPPHAIQPHPSSGRPGIDRAHTFPTPPTSASSIMGMGNQGSSYEWNGSNVQNAQGGQPLSIDTGLSNTRSVPTTPASTPPGAVQQGMSYASGQSFDGSRPLYSGLQHARCRPQHILCLGESHPPCCGTRVQVGSRHVEHVCLPCRQS